MRRIRVLSLLCLSLAAGAAGANDPATFSTPDGVDEALEAKALAFRLHYDTDQWQLRPQRSQLALLARMIHADGAVTGAFDYREQPMTPDEVRRRERSELADAFADHEIGGFERRRVNGHDVLFMRARATTTDGRRLVIRNYLWLGDEGTADYGLVVEANDYERYRPAMLDLLNGFDRRTGEADS